jgi:signal transduction histidine kinase
MMKLMIVDDHAGVRQTIRSQVATQNDAVCECASGDEAVKMAGEFNPDAVTMDVRMPGMTGFEATRAIRANVPAARVVFVTSYDEPALRQAAREAGAFDYVLKDDLSTLRDALTREDIHGEALQREMDEVLFLDEPEEAKPNPVDERIRRLEQELRERECFPGMVAHELAAPLRIINRFASLIQHRYSSVLPQDGQECLDIIVKHGRLMTDRLEGLINLSRSTGSPKTGEVVVLDDLVRDVWRGLASETQNRVQFKTSRLPDVYGDKALLRLVMENLLSNAVKFSSQRPLSVIEVGSSTLPEKIVIFVRDNGVGFNMRRAKGLFEPLSRLHSHKEFAGVGLGLAITRRIIQQHGGNIWTEAAEDRGATFYFSLPARPPGNS